MHTAVNQNARVTVPHQIREDDRAAALARARELIHMLTEDRRRDREMIDRLKEELLRLTRGKS